MTRQATEVTGPAERLLLAIHAAEGSRVKIDARRDADSLACLLRADLVALGPSGIPRLTDAGGAHLARRKAATNQDDVDSFSAQHLALARRVVETPRGKVEVLVNDAESPLAWLARRKGRDGRSGELL